MDEPKRNLNSLSRLAVKSFTLVEVVIAIGVIAFVLISILGLMTYASQLVRQSDSYSRLSNVAGQVLAQFDSQSFAVSTNRVATNALYYYTYEGLPTNSADGYYECDVSNVDSLISVLTNVMQIQLSIRWPKPEFANTNVIITSTLNYD